MATDERRDRRFVFGEVAELYDLARPRYPSALFDDLLELAGLGEGSPVLEVGAGTGQATVDLAGRGLEVTALEPSEEMLAVARRRCGSERRVSLVHATFEDWEGPAGTFAMVTAAQAWHWIPEQVAYPKAARLLRPRGWLAFFWNLPVDRGPASGDIDEVYARYSPERGTISRWGGQDSSGTGEVPQYGQQLAASDLFGPVEERSYPWERTYTADEYLRLVRTHSDYRLLEESTRPRFLEALREVIDEHGGEVTVTFRTQLYAAPRV